MKPLQKITALICILTIHGCAVREHAFDCTNLANKEESDELLMTPTTLRFQSTDYRFIEERGTLRIYAKQNPTERIEFNAASGRLTTERNQWQCKKFTLDVERR